MRDLEKQEDLVTALWQFAHAQQTKPHDITSEFAGGTSVNLEAITAALRGIMAIFEVEVTDIQ